MTESIIWLCHVCKVDGPGETVEEADMGCRAEEALNKIDAVMK